MTLSGCGGAIQTERMDFPGFTMEVPSGWELENTSDDMFTSYVYHEPKDEPEKSITIQYFDDEYNLEDDRSHEDLAIFFEDNDYEGYSMKHENVEEAFINGKAMIVGDETMSVEGGKEYRTKGAAFYYEGTNSVLLTITTDDASMEQYAEKAIESIEITG